MQTVNNLKNKIQRNYFVCILMWFKCVLQGDVVPRHVSLHLCVDILLVSVPGEPPVIISGKSTCTRILEITTQEFATAYWIEISIQVIHGLVIDLMWS